MMAHLCVSRDSRTLFENNDISGYEISGFEFAFLAVSNDGALHRDTRLKLRDDVSGLPEAASDRNL